MTKQAVNVMLSGGILFTTCLVSKVLRALTSVNIAVHAKRTYSRHQRRYLFPVSALPLPQIHQHNEKPELTLNAGKLLIIDSNHFIFSS